MSNYEDAGGTDFRRAKSRLAAKSGEENLKN